MEQVISIVLGYLKNKLWIFTCLTAPAWQACLEI